MANKNADKKTDRHNTGKARKAAATTNAPTVARATHSGGGHGPGTAGGGHPSVAGTGHGGTAGGGHG